MGDIPWIEKYRPDSFDKIVLSDINKTIFENILKNNYFPNLLLYGPPGTGKTTSIINLINRFQEENGLSKRGTKIHLNASDDRGIDIIRNQIKSFVTSNGLFNKNIKFVIFDEVDYMTKNAQCALRYLIQKYKKNVRYCLMCNYVSRLDNMLLNEFVSLKFCNLPKEKTIHFLDVIVKAEKLKISNAQLKSIQNFFVSDIRNMVNYLQSNHSFLSNDQIITNDVWENCIKSIRGGNFKQYVKKNCIKYNMEIRFFIVNFFKYVLKTKPYALNETWIDVFKKIIHLDKGSTDITLDLCSCSLGNLFLNK